jgi:3-hydroxyisobutyrate dehydrogenase-like beta-hydroxyacid dehydrogenase
MNIGFIGIGRMGRFMARNLAKGGHNLTVFDTHRDAAEELLSQVALNPDSIGGASWADSPGAVAAASQVVFTALPRPQDVEAAALGDSGILSGAARGLAYFDLSTTDPDTIHRIADAAKPKGIHVLDAPVSGGVTGAEQATLCIMVGGDQSVYTSYEPLLGLIGEKVLYCGGQGMGAVCKIVNNLINLGNYVLVSEALTLGLKAGAKTETMFEAISHSSGNTECMQEFPASLFQGNFEPGFKLDLGAKDVGLATELGRQLRLPMELANIIEQRFTEARNRGWGELASVSVAQLQEERADVKIRV